MIAYLLGWVCLIGIAVTYFRQRRRWRDEDDLAAANQREDESGA